MELVIAIIGLIIYATIRGTEKSYRKYSNKEFEKRHAATNALEESLRDFDATEDAKQKKENETYFKECLAEAQKAIDEYRTRLMRKYSYAWNPRKTYPDEQKLTATKTDAYAIGYAKNGVCLFLRPGWKGQDVDSNKRVNKYLIPKVLSALREHGHAFEVFTEMNKRYDGFYVSYGSIVIYPPGFADNLPGHFAPAQDYDFAPTEVRRKIEEATNHKRPDTFGV